MIAKSLAVLTVGSLVGMMVLEGNVQRSFEALHIFMTVFSSMLLVAYLNFD